MKHFKISFKSDGRQISTHAGATLLEAAGQAGIILNSVCGGKGICKKCKVILEPDGQEVMACQYHVQSDLTVTIPDSSKLFEQKILTKGIDTKPKFEPDIYKKYLKDTAADRIFGVAADIGTTTVVVKLVDMKAGKCFAVEAALNPQTKYGEDVVSRIAHAQTKEKLAELQKAIIDCINKLIAKLCDQAGINAKQIYEMCVVGNTTMNHIFLGLPISQLGRAPYKAHSLDACDLPPEKLDLQINPKGNIHTVENIAGFVGSDTTAVALAVDIDSAEEITLAVDIGTNGEIVLGTKNKLYAASCAAGPAFEGARITCGSRAVDGAIEAIIVNDEGIDVDVIGNCPPRSICGSGLVDAVAVLLDLGIIDKTGRFTDIEKLQGKLPPDILKRIIEHGGQTAFVLADNEEKKVLLTQKDIREVQLAKAAIRAGIKILQKEVKLTDSDIEQILLAGAFGSYIRPTSAITIGLLPNIPLERIHFVGNAASAGAQILLLSGQAREKTHQLARQIQYIEIANRKDFQNVFAESMTF
jgi:uncharacterized 2Fe-2S/4Fe-4S cluster protein (DUF4445 family)